MQKRIFLYALFLVMWVWPPLLHGKELEHTSLGSLKSRNVSDQSSMVQGHEHEHEEIRELEAYKYNKMMSKLGSRPPKCEHSCGNCKPCKAIQVPTNSDRLGLLYANYEPEGWKCKCGSAFFNP